MDDLSALPDTPARDRPAFWPLPGSPQQQAVDSPLLRVPHLRRRGFGRFSPVAAGHRGPGVAGQAAPSPSPPPDDAGPVSPRADGQDGDPALEIPGAGELCIAWQCGLLLHMLTWPRLPCSQVCSRLAHRSLKSLGSPLQQQPHFATRCNRRSSSCLEFRKLVGGCNRVVGRV